MKPKKKPDFAEQMATRLVAWFISAIFKRIFGFGHRPDMVYLPLDHPDMKAAIKLARESLPQFREALLNPPAGATGFTLKVAFPVVGGNEHCWLREIQIKGESYQGLLDNVPDKLPKMRIGDPVEIPSADISDWGYMQNGVAQGFHTTRALLPHMKRRARKVVMKQFGWK
ncbi:MAG: DUF2314 domain-containing protein [Verrucomicrobiota bacterium]